MTYFTGRFDASRIRRENRPANVVPIRPSVAQVNHDTAGQMLGALSNVELDTHIGILTAEHDLKRTALATVANSLARALNERSRRRG